MPELGALEPGQAASLAGLAPMTRPSGRWTGGAFIRGGRAEIRQAVYMPALVAARFNPDMRAKYRQLTAAGKPAKVALTAVTRKLIVLVNAFLKANRNWAPKYVSQNGYSRRPALGSNRSGTYRSEDFVRRWRERGSTMPPVKSLSRRNERTVDGDSS
jgi:hypothetical protein